MKRTTISSCVALAVTAMAASAAEAGTTNITVTANENNLIDQPYGQDKNAVDFISAGANTIYDISSGTEERTQTLTFNNKNENTDSFLKAVDGAQIKVHNLDKLIFKTDVPMGDHGNNNPILLTNSGKASFSEINTVQFGTAENPLKVDQVIHAYANAGGVEFANIKNLDIHGMSTAIHLQSYNSGTLLKISNVENVSITGKKETSFGIQLSAIGNKQEPTNVQKILEVSGVKNFNLQGGYAGLYTNDELRWSTGSDASSNALEASISAENITMEGGTAAIVNKRANEKYISEASKTTFDINATNSIRLASSSGSGVMSKVTIGDSSRAVTNITAPVIVVNADKDALSADGGTINVKGDAVSLTGEANAVSVTKGDINFTNMTEGKRTELQLNGNVSSVGGTLIMENQNATLIKDAIFNAGTLKGNNTSIKFNTNKKDAVTIKDNQSKNLEIIADGALADQYSSAEAMYNAMTKKDGLVSVNGNNKATYAGEAGTVSDSFTSDADGNLKVTKNASLEAYAKFSAATLAQWRDENSTLTERLGDLRDNKHGIGTWARIYGTDSKLKDNISVDVNTSSLQVGTDIAIGNNWLAGAAFAYTDMDADFSNGSGSSDGYSVAAYLSGYFDYGGYLDVIGRVGRLSTDMKASTISVSGGILDVSYDNTAFSLSAETGWRWQINPMFYVEPQAQITYGYVVGDDFTSNTNSVLVNQENFQTLVGRIGTRVGAQFADGAGNLYLQTSVHHDFLGDADATATALTTGKRVSVDADLSGTWVSYGLGAQFNATEAWSFYGSLTRANGSEYQEDYRYSVGTRFVF